MELPHADKIVSLLGVSAEPGMDWPSGWNTPAFSAISVFQTVPLNIGTDIHNPETVLTCVADASFFSVLSVGPKRGRLFSQEDAEAGASPVAVVSDAFWRSHFGNTQDLAGAKFFGAGHWIHVIGVLPAEVVFPAHAAIYLPHRDQMLLIHDVNQKSSADDIFHGFDRVIARLRPGFTVAQATGMLKALNERLREISKDPHRPLSAVGVRLLRDTVTIYVKGELTEIILAGVFVALVGFLSLFFVSTARAAGLQKDIAIRVALGASMGKLFRQEVMWWICAGSVASAAVLAFVKLALMIARTTEGVAVPRLGDLSLTLPQATWIVAATMTVAILLSLPYVLACGRAEPLTPVLNRGEMLSRITVRPSVGKLISIGQLSLALALTALAIRASVDYWRISTTPPGIDASGVFVSQPISAAALNLGNQPALPPDAKAKSSDAQSRSNHADEAARYSKLENGVPQNPTSSDSTGPIGDAGLFPPANRETPAARAARQEIEQQEATQALDEVARQPNVGGVALIEPVPYQPDAGGGQFVQVNGKVSEEALPVFHVRGDIPKVLGLRVMRGRWFDAGDEKIGSSVVVVGNALAQQYFSGDAVGRSVVVEGTGADSRMIIGVVDDVVSNYGLGPLPAVYILMSPHADSGSIVVKMTSGAARAPFPVRNAPGSLLMFERWSSLSRMMSDAGATDRASATVAAWFAILVLLLSAAGAYAVFWMITIQRQREMAIRICFGALPARVALGLVLNGIVLACCAGVGGFAIQQTMQRVLSSRIYQFPAFSWSTFLISFGVITAATLLSVARPARSVLRISPAELLRDN
ncbi:MAG TPA: ABC transporter permease [Candidatus Acidoferrales bacterium]|nr:ABC transporter permease [Candidatus Acidoferrales bacterium]